MSTFDPATHPKDGHRYVCSVAHPMPAIQPNGTYWFHPDAKDDPYNDPYYDWYNCPTCGLNFKVEVAE